MDNRFLSESMDLERVNVDDCYVGQKIGICSTQKDQ